MTDLPDDLSSVSGGFVGDIGLEVSVEDGDVRGRLEISADHHQPYGLVHGGVYCTIVETLASVAAAVRVMADGKGAVGVSNSTDFLRSAREGTLEAVAEPIHIGRTQHLWQVRIWRDDGKAVARGQVRMQVIDDTSA